MFRLIKFLLFLVVIVVVGYFLLGISLGEKTLFAHLQSIFGSEEAQTLKNEIEKKVDDATENLKSKASDLAKEQLKDEIEEALGGTDSPQTKAPPSGSTEPLLDAPTATESDRKELNALIDKMTPPEASADDRAALSRLIGDKIKEKP